jgi:hypothetical protein
MYVYATYSSSGQSWALSAPQVAFSAANIAASTPAFAADAAGNLWCAFTAQDLTTLQYEETVVYRAAKTSAWIPTGVVFGSISGTLQHSARPVPYNNGIGMLYQDGQTLYWAYRQTGWPLDAPWTTSTVYAGLPPYSQDPYGSHYSVVADAANNLHLALIANQQLIYMRFLSSTNAWGAPRPLTASSTNAAYSQATLAGGNLLLMANNLASIVVFQSTNSGNTFALTQVLRHPAAAPGSSLDYTNPRVESPSRASSPVPVFQQFVSGSTQSLMYFQVPVVK